MSTGRAWLQRWVWFVAFPLAVALALGQDANWDLRNYHLYNPHAWWTGRWVLDIAPAQLQSWHSPYLDLPVYLMARAGWLGPASTIWLTLPVIASLWALDRLVPIGSSVRERTAWPFVLALCVVGGATALQEIGTTMNDTFVAAGVLWALVFCTRSDGVPWKNLFVAGLLAGAISGLKLTAIPYCIGIAVAAAISGTIADAPRRLSFLAIGGITGATLTFGPWAWTLQERFGNPFFPYFNHVFLSPWALPVSHEDARFGAESISDIVLAPFRLLLPTQRFGESIIADPRILVALTLLPWLAWRYRSSVEASSANRSLVAFAFVSTAAWAALSSVYRYALPIEMLGGFAFAVVVSRWQPLGAVVAAILLVAVTDHAKQARVSQGAPLIQTNTVSLPSRSMVITIDDAPMAYLAMGLPQDTPWISLRNNFMHPKACTRLQQRAEAAFREHEGPRFLLVANGHADSAAKVLFDAYGATISSPCIEVDTAADEMRFCPLSPPSAPPTCGTPNDAGP